MLHLLQKQQKVSKTECGTETTVIVTHNISKFKGSLPCDQICFVSSRCTWTDPLYSITFSHLEVKWCNSNPVDKVLCTFTLTNPAVLRLRIGNLTCFGGPKATLKSKHYLKLSVSENELYKQAKGFSFSVT